jgi:hypothetical protein
VRRPLTADPVNSVDVTEYGYRRAELVVCGNTNAKLVPSRSVARWGLPVVSLEQLVEALLESAGGFENLGRKPLLAFAAQQISKQKLASDANRGQLGAELVFGSSALVRHRFPPREP